MDWILFDISTEKNLQSACLIQITAVQSNNMSSVGNNNHFLFRGCYIHIHPIDKDLGYRTEQPINFLLECVSKSIPACIMQEVCEYRPDGQRPENGQRVYHSG